MEKNVPTSFLFSRGAGGVRVDLIFRRGRSAPLNHVVRHSPTGIEWGYAGSGPADLARSVLLALSVNEETVDALYHDFKRDVVATIPHSGASIETEEIERWLVDRGAKRREDGSWSF